jgi:hypothetical protein
VRHIETLLLIAHAPALVGSQGERRLDGHLLRKPRRMERSRSSFPDRIVEMFSKVSLTGLSGAAYSCRSLPYAASSHRLTRCTVLTPTPSSRAVLTMPLPLARATRMLP